MAKKSQALTRRNINRLLEVCQRNAERYPAMAAFKDIAGTHADAVNTAWQTYQATSIQGDSVRESRNENLDRVKTWIQSWRPIVLAVGPGADENLRLLPAGGGTPDEIIQIATDLLKIITDHPDLEPYRELALNDLSNLLEQSRDLISSAKSAWVAERRAQLDYSEVVNESRRILVLGTQIVRANFGANSPEYKQFIVRDYGAEDDEDDVETLPEEEPMDSFMDEDDLAADAETEYEAAENVTA